MEYWSIKGINVYQRFLIFLSRQISQLPDNETQNLLELESFIVRDGEDWDGAPGRQHEEDDSQHPEASLTPSRSILPRKVSDRHWADIVI